MDHHGKPRTGTGMGRWLARSIMEVTVMEKHRHHAAHQEMTFETVHEWPEESGDQGEEEGSRGAGRMRAQAAGPAAPSEIGEIEVLGEVGRSLLSSQWIVDGANNIFQSWLSMQGNDTYTEV